MRGDALCCLRCGHRWKQRLDSPPKRCDSCCTRVWNVPKTKRPIKLPVFLDIEEEELARHLDGMTRDQRINALLLIALHVGSISDIERVIMRERQYHRNYKRRRNVLVANTSAREAKGNDALR